MGVTHNMQLFNVPFEAIRSGVKTIEVRLNDSKRKSVMVGDTIVFTNTVTKEVVEVEVVSRYECVTFLELYSMFPPSAFGFAGTVSQCVEETFKSYYSKEQEAKYGVVGLGIKLVSS